MPYGKSVDVFYQIFGPFKIRGRAIVFIGLVFQDSNGHNILGCEPGCVLDDKLLLPGKCLKKLVKGLEIIFSHTPGLRPQMPVHKGVVPIAQGHFKPCHHINGFNSKIF